MGTKPAGAGMIICEVDVVVLAIIEILVDVVI
jgi:hypothetical protein